MGFLAPVLPALASTLGFTGATSAAAGAGAGLSTIGAATAAGAGAAATGSAAAGIGAVGSAAAGTAAGAGIGAGILSASKLLAPSILAGALPSLLAPKPGKPPSAPITPMPSMSGATSFFGSMEGTQGGTFGGNNRAPQISGGKKTLLGG